MFPHENFVVRAILNSNHQSDAHVVITTTNIFLKLK